MGSEERKDAACSFIMHSERMYQETKNPYFILRALHASNWGDFTPPEWALDALLKAVHGAMRKHNETGKRISLDDALGLSLKRGNAPCESRAHRASIERNSFDLVRTIHVCFDVPIPTACEIAYSAIDFNFARAWEEDLWKPREGVPRLPLGMTLQQWTEIDARHRAESECAIDALLDPDVVKAKMRSGSLWSVTRGDRLGYGLDQFIDRYYRVGSKQKSRNAKLGQHVEFFEGHSLLLTAEYCTSEITLADVAAGYRPRSISAVANLPKRPEFERFIQRFDEAVRK